MWSSLRNWYRALEARQLARMTEAQRLDTLQIDHALKRNAWRLLAFFVVLIAFAATLLSRFAPKIGFGEALIVVTLLIVCVAVTFFVAWVGYDRFGPRRLTYLLRSIVLAILGGFTGAFVASGFDVENFTRFLSTRSFDIVLITGTVGLALATLAQVIVFMRKREMTAVQAHFESRQREERLGHHLTETRLRLLQMQVEPHFLFNTLGAVRQLAEGRANEAATLVAYLIEFLRSGLAGLRDEGSTLGREAAMIEAYLAIMKTRFDARLAWSVDVPKALRDVPIPPALLISLVENAVKHGIEPWPPGGRIDITATGGGDAEPIVVTIADTGAGMQAQPGNGMGLSNVRERLAITYGAAARLDLRENEPRGFVATLTLPRSLPVVDVARPVATPVIPHGC